MPLRLLLVLVLALALPASAAPPKTVDLSDQFPDEATRQQGKIGACHIFTTISLIEAALHRAYGVHLPLSEADLFVRQVVADAKYYEKASLAVGAEDWTSSAYKFVEGGSPYDDIRFVMKTGAAKAKTAPWDAFTKRYREYKSLRKTQIEAKRHDVVETARLLETTQGQIKDDYAAVGHLEDSGLADRTAQIRRVNIQKLNTTVSTTRLASIDSFRLYLALIAGMSAVQAEELLLGDDPQLAKDRAYVKTLLTPMRVRKLEFPAHNPSLYGKADPDAACRTAGLTQRIGLLAALDKSIPVSVSMELAGLKEWNSENDKTAMHAFTIVGYEKDEAGALTLKSRNSWGGNNPDVPEKHFCRITRVVAVLIPKE